MEHIFQYALPGDRLMGTEHPGYVKAYDKIQERRFGQDREGSSRHWKVALVFMAFVVGLGLISAKAQHGIEGKWKDETKGGVIEIYEENGLYFGKLISADNPEENEKVQAYGEDIILMRNFEKKSDTKYCCGKMYQPKFKRTISATLILEDSNTLKIKGSYGVVKGTRIWKRV